MSNCVPVEWPKTQRSHLRETLGSRHRSADGPASKADGMIAGGNDWTPPRSQEAAFGKSLSTVATAANNIEIPTEKLELYRKALEQRLTRR